MPDFKVKLLFHLRNMMLPLQKDKLIEALFIFLTFENILAAVLTVDTGVAIK